MLEKAKSEQVTFQGLTSFVRKVKSGSNIIKSLIIKGKTPFFGVMLGF